MLIEGYARITYKYMLVEELVIECEVNSGFTLKRK